jgi:hypothetical protein
MDKTIQKELQKPLNVSEIDFRIQSINKGKFATILAYKDARADMNRLDDVLGVFNWKRHHTRDNKNCIVSIYDKEKDEWIGKEDTGTESAAEKDKGLASDSFKRACFNLGIGRELYDYPLISVKLKDDEVTEFNGKFKASFNLKLRDWSWNTSFAEGKLVELTAIDTNGVVRFKWFKNSLKPQLKLGSPEYKKVKEALAGGKFTIEQVKTKYVLSAEIEKSLV